MHPPHGPPACLPACSKKKGHVEALKREVEVLRRLRGCLNVAALEEVRLNGWLFRQRCSSSLAGSA